MELGERGMMMMMSDAECIAELAAPDYGLSVVSVGRLQPPECAGIKIVVSSRTDQNAAMALYLYRCRVRDQMPPYLALDIRLQEPTP